MSFLKIMVDRSKKRASSVGANDSNKLIFKKNSFHDDYTNKKEIGEGMNGKVFLCESKIDHKNYAVKVRLFFTTKQQKRKRTLSFKLLQKRLKF